MMRRAVLILAIAVLAGCDGSGGESSKVKFVGGDRVSLAGEIWGCRDQKARDELDAQHDINAYRTLMGRFVQADRCRPIRAGSKLDVISVALWSGRTEARLVGKPDAWWLSTSRLGEEGTKIGSWQQPVNAASATKGN